MRTRYYTVDRARFLVHYRGYSLSLTMGPALLELAMNEIDWQLRPRWMRA